MAACADRASAAIQDASGSSRPCRILKSTIRVAAGCCEPDSHEKGFGPGRRRPAARHGPEGTQITLPPMEDVEREAQARDTWEGGEAIGSSCRADMGVVEDDTTAPETASKGCEQAKQGWDPQGEQ